MTSSPKANKKRDRKRQGMKNRLMGHGSWLEHLWRSVMESVYMSAVYYGSEIHINIDHEILRLNRPENLVTSTEKPHSIHETETKLCQIQNCMEV